MDKAQKELAQVIEKYFGADAGYLDISCLDLAKRILDEGWKKPEWISVKDRLPEDSVAVNLHTRSGVVGTGFYNKYTKNWWQWYCGGSIFVDVTHWMPLPQPPKGE